MRMHHPVGFVCACVGLLHIHKVTLVPRLSMHVRFKVEGHITLWKTSHSWLVQTPFGNKRSGFIPAKMQEGNKQTRSRASSLRGNRKRLGSEIQEAAPLEQ